MIEGNHKEERLISGALIISRCAVGCKPMLGDAAQGVQDSLVASLDEGDRFVLVHAVLSGSGGNRGPSEVIKWRRDSHGRTIGRDEVLKQKEVNVTSKVLKELEEPGVSP